MAELTTLQATAKRLVRTCEEGLVRMERMEAASSAAAMKETERRLKDLKVTVQQMENTLGSAFSMPAGQRADWKRKVERVKTASRDIEHGVKRHQYAASKKEKEDTERAALFEGASTSQGNGDLDSDARAFGNARSARRAVEEMLTSGADILAGMGATRDRLKRTQRKMLDVVNSLGLSERILKLADRRNRGDAMIVYGGMALVTMVIVIFFIWYHR